LNNHDVKNHDMLVCDLDVYMQCLNMHQSCKNIFMKIQTRGDYFSQFCMKVLYVDDSLQSFYVQVALQLEKAAIKTIFFRKDKL